MDEYEEIDRDAAEALIKYCKKSKKELKKMKPYELQFLKQYMDRDTRDSLGVNEDEQ